MIVAVDTSAFSRALASQRDESSAAVRSALRWNIARFPPLVVTELVANPRMTEGVRRLIEIIPVLEIHPGYWSRAGLLRAELKHRLGFKANLADCLIAQSCIDHDIPLITYDRDFRHFVQAGLTFA